MGGDKLGRRWSGRDCTQSRELPIGKKADFVLAVIVAEALRERVK
jgi:hypothetical protein